MSLKVPAGTQDGKLLRIKGRGAPKLKGEGRGDLLARVQVTVPTKLTKAEREAIENLQKVSRENPREHAGHVTDDRPRYMISVAAELVGMHPQTLRIYETKGLVRPRRTAGNTRLYSERDLDRLRAIQRLTTELGLNLAGVERVLALEDEVAAAAQARLDAARAPSCGRRSSRCTSSTAATSSRLSDPTTDTEGHDGFQQADDQGPGGRRGARRSSRASAATPRSTPSTCCSRCSTRSCRRRSRSVRARPPRRSGSEAEDKLSRRPAVRGAHEPAAAGVGAFRKVLDDAENEAKRLEDDYVSTEHLLLALDVAAARRSCSTRSRRCAAASASPRRTRRAPTRRSRSTAAT